MAKARKHTVLMFRKNPAAPEDAAPRCCFHLAGNAQCPYPPLYLVGWQNNQTARPLPWLTREVCLMHLQPAIDQAIERSPVNVAIEVKLADHMFPSRYKR